MTQKELERLKETLEKAWWDRSNFDGQLMKLAANQEFLRDLLLDLLREYIKLKPGIQRC